MAAGSWSEPRAASDWDAARGGQSARAAQLALLLGVLDAARPVDVLEAHLGWLRAAGLQPTVLDATGHYVLLAARR